MTNTSSKDYVFELVPPNPKVSGIMINPLVKTLEAGKGTLVSIKYDSKFRDLTHQSFTEMNKP